MAYGTARHWRCQSRKALMAGSPVVRKEDVLEVGYRVCQAHTEPLQGLAAMVGLTRLHYRCNIHDTRSVGRMKFVYETPLHHRRQACNRAASTIYLVWWYCTKLFIQESTSSLISSCAYKSALEQEDALRDLETPPRPGCHCLKNKPTSIPMLPLHSRS